VNTQLATASPVVRPWVSASTPAAAKSHASIALSSASIAVPTGLAALGALLLARADGEKSGGLAAVGAAAATLAARWQLGRIFTWQPPYTVELRYGRLEVRHYSPQLLARTWVEDEPWGATLEQGFERLAGYLFGGNEAETFFTMTSPVLLSVPASSSQRQNGQSWDAPAVAELGELVGPATREMAFVMRGDLTLEDLPRPKDRRVRLDAVPGRRVAALAFRGRYGGDLPAQKRNELLFLTKLAGLKPASQVSFAAYDGPSTLPFLRRNEVLVEVE
jgi:hypothetical protein